MFTLIDLTQSLGIDSSSYPGTVPVWVADRMDVDNPEATLTRFSDFDPHGGTHIDAPRHFAPGGVDVAGLALKLYRAHLVPVDGQQIESASVPPDCTGDAVLFFTGWDDRIGSAEYYKGFPYLSEAAARCLVERGVGLVGLDTPSADGSEAGPVYPVHRILCGAGVPIVEGLTNLAALRQYKDPILFSAWPLKLRGIEGSPVRAVALVHSGDGGTVV